MVNTDGQLYTIEGIAAGLIMLLTAYIVVNSTSVYTLGDTHISDMQLEVLGSDALSLMNTAPNSTFGKSPLQVMVENNDKDAFVEMFDNTVNNRTIQKRDGIQFMANVTYVRPEPDTTLNASTPLGMSRSLTGGEHAVRVSQWVIVDSKIPEDSVVRKHAELVEVLLWRD